MVFDFQVCWTHTHTSWTVGVDEKEGAYWNLIWFIIILSMMWIICFLCLMWFRHCKNSKTGEDQKYISFKKTKRGLLLLHLRAKNFQKYKNKIQIYSLQNTILLTTTIAIAKTTTTLQCGEIFLFFFVLLENDSRGGSKTKCLFSRALKHKYLFICIINLFFM